MPRISAVGGSIVAIICCFIPEISLVGCAVILSLILWQLAEARLDNE